MKNEIVNVEQYLLKKKVIEKEFFDKYEQYKTLKEWFDTFKYKFQQTGLRKWENDVFTCTAIGESTTTKMDEARLKNTNIYIVNGETGELEEMNAYDFMQQFKIKTPKKGYVQVKEKK